MKRVELGMSVVVVGIWGLIVSGCASVQPTTEGRLDAQQPVVAVALFDAISGISSTEANMITRVFFIRLGNTNKVSLVDRSVVERVLREHAFQARDWSNPQKTAKLGTALNADWIVRGEIEKFISNSNILVTVQFYDLRTFRYMGGTDLLLANANEAYDKIDPLVNKLVETISGSSAGGGSAGTGASGASTTSGMGSSGRSGGGVSGTGSGGGSPMPANMVRIAGGTFTMGSPASEVGRLWYGETQHQVTISKPFYIGKYEVTQKEWVEIMGSNPSNWRGDNLPVEHVSWYDAIEYCNKRSEKEKLTPAYTIDKTRRDGNNSNGYDDVKWVVTWNRDANGYRLPTEAEWELACRAGTSTPFYTGNNITTNQANYNGNNPYNNNAKGENRGKIWEVGSGTPNPWGLYDMSGNVREWCWDWYENYESYESGTQTDPAGAAGGSDRVFRGGSWSDGAQGVRSADRNHNGFTPSYRYSSFVGFRLVRP
jgi:formylglycine-generating enzyme required for sulfatase activity